MRYLFGFICVLALGVMGCSDSEGTDGSGGTAGTGGTGGDGGATWVAQSSGTTDLLLAVSFTDANTGTAVGGYDGFDPPYTSVILRTTDGGATWVAQSSGTLRALNVVYRCEHRDRRGGGRNHRADDRRWGDVGDAGQRHDERSRRRIVYRREHRDRRGRLRDHCADD